MCSRDAHGSEMGLCMASLPGYMRDGVEEGGRPMVRNCRDRQDVLFSALWGAFWSWNVFGPTPDSAGCGWRLYVS